MRERLFYLLSRYYRKICTPEEQKELFNLLADSSNEASVKEFLLETYGYNEVDILNSASSDEILQAVFSTNKKNKSVKRGFALWRWSAAAAILFALATGAYFWLHNNNPEQPPAGNQAPVSSNIAPGRDGAILTLADGSQILLDSIKNSVVALQNGVTARVVNGELVYEGTGGDAAFNEISTPKGRQYRVTLPDGSQVLLNAASSIRYPINFIGYERNVDVTGEAYFEVAENKNMPFKLNVNNKATIEVLGTKFNVNAYDNEQNINTTLLEGSVKVNGTTIKPGQQAQVDNHAPGKVQVINNVNTDNVMAWTNGIFYFDRADIREIMRQVQRWYDFEVVYESVPAKRFSGTLPRNAEIAELFKLLSLTGNIQYRIENNTVYIGSR